MTDQRALLDYTLRLADNALIIGHRLSEWCGHAPILEQDIAMTNIALDHLGQARSFYQYAAQQVNEMAANAKQEIFSDNTLQQKINKGEKVDEDDLAYLRDAWDFRNVLLVEQPNKDWAYTVIRSFFYDTFNYFFYSALLQSKDETFAAIAEKSLKEVSYHRKWSSEWVIRLGDGTSESHDKIQTALDDMWMFTDELFAMDETDNQMLSKGIGVDLQQVKKQWSAYISGIFDEATIDAPDNAWMQAGGKEGRHSEHLGFILAELQFMQRAYPGMEW